MQLQDRRRQNHHLAGPDYQLPLSRSPCRSLIDCLLSGRYCKLNKKWSGINQCCRHETMLYKRKCHFEIHTNLGGYLQQPNLQMGSDKHGCLHQCMHKNSWNLVIEVNPSDKWHRGMCYWKRECSKEISANDSTALLL